MFFYDYYYIILVIPAMFFAMWAQSKVASTSRKYSQVRTGVSMTGYEAARRILDANGLRNVQIERVSGDLTDHYDPRTNVIRLSDTVYGESTVTAIGVAAHEVGHAIQYAENYSPIKLRAAIIPISQIGSTIAFPLILLGLVLPMFEILIPVGVLLFASIALFQLITLPVEFNASARAVEALEKGGAVSSEEMGGVKKVLNAAALTYVAALAVSLANLLRILLIVAGRRRD